MLTKVVTIFALACIAATSSAPAVKAINWSAVGDKFGEFEALLKDAFQRVKDIANADNAAIGSDIAVQLDAATVKTDVVFAAVPAKIADQTLTDTEAIGYVIELFDIFRGVRNDLQDEIAQLSTGAADQIQNIFYSTYANADTIAYEVYALLRE